MTFKLDRGPDGGFERRWNLVGGGAEATAVDGYTPSLYVAGADPYLDGLVDSLRRDPKVVATGFETKRCGLRDRDGSRALRIDCETDRDLRSLARELVTVSSGDLPPGAIRLFNVDISPQFRYCLQSGRDPSPNRELRTLELDLSSRAVADEDLGALVVGGVEAGSRDRALSLVSERLTADDPDVLVLERSDIVPLLFRAARDADREEFQLGRRAGFRQLAGESTFESYGRVGHSPARYDLPGRVIVDRSNSFLYGKAGLPGLLDLVGRSHKPLQETAWGSIGNNLTAIQIREALERDILVPWEKWEPESFKSPQTLHAADRGGFTFEPDVGLHRSIVELDFASLYPNIMVKHNLSPETVRCPCHDDREDVPGLDYGICDDRGFIPDTLEPIIEDRARLKEQRKQADDSGEVAELDGRIDALKWILVSCFGYQGYRNAKFGRIECHESINAYAREILLDAKAILEEHGWRVVHGIVDSLWVTPADGKSPAPIGQVARTVTDDIGIEFEVEDAFEWVAFVPMRNSASGALTKYFGSKLFKDEYKFRGIEARQRSTTEYVAQAQWEMIRALDERRSPEAVVDIAGKHISRLRSNTPDADSLVVTRRVSKGVDEYDRETLSVAALRRAENLGIGYAPGQDIEFVVVDAARDGAAAVRLPFEPVGRYDGEFYADRIVRACESVLSPLGWRESDIREHLAETSDTKLSSFG